MPRTYARAVSPSDIERIVMKAWLKPEERFQTVKTAMDLRGSNREWSMKRTERS